MNEKGKKPNMSIAMPYDSGIAILGSSIHFIIQSQYFLIQGINNKWHLVSFHLGSFYSNYSTCPLTMASHSSAHPCILHSCLPLLHSPIQVINGRAGTI